MPHTSVLVLTDWLPAAHRLGKVLQPWHRFEHTGSDDKHVQDVDVTQEYINLFRTDSHGHNNFLSYLIGVHGLHAVTVMPNDDLPDVVNDRNRFGYVLVDRQYKTVRQVIRRTNPNGKWTGWRIGGRFAGRLISKNLHMAIRGEADISMYHGASGCCDIARVEELYLERMRQRNIEKRKWAIKQAFDSLNIPAAQVQKLWNEAAEAGGWSKAASMWLQDPSGCSSPQDYIMQMTANHPIRKAFASGVIQALSNWDGAGCGVPDDKPNPQLWASDAPTLDVQAVIRNGEWHECDQSKNSDGTVDTYREWLNEVLLALRTHHKQWASVIDCYDHEDGTRWPIAVND